MVAGGLKANALPSSAKAVVNCRILPDESVEQVRLRLVAALDNAKIGVKSLRGDKAAPEVPVDGEVPQAIAAVAAQMWPGAAVVPSMSSATTDSRHLRSRGILAYGFNTLPESHDDMARVHGADERLPVAAIEPGLEFFYKLVVKLAGTGQNLK